MQQFKEAIHECRGERSTFVPGVLIGSPLLEALVFLLSVKSDAPPQRCQSTVTRLSRAKHGNGLLGLYPNACAVSFTLSPRAVHLMFSFTHPPIVSAHQQLHAEVESLRKRVRSGEQRVQDCAQRLTEADAALKGPLKAAKSLLEAGRKAEAGELAVSPESRTLNKKGYTR